MYVTIIYQPCLLQIHYIDHVVYVATDSILTRNLLLYHCGIMLNVCSCIIILSCFMIECNNLNYYNNINNKINNI